MARKTRSPEPPEAFIDTAELDRLGISYEVGWYLATRGVPLPACPPKFATPSPGEAPGAQFDPERVDRVLKSFHLLRHTQGQWAGRPLDPDPWQVAYIIAPVFGWVHRNDAGDWVRVVRNLYVEVPRKNGKTTLAGGLAMYLTAADGEAGAQVVAAAASKDQAKLCFDPVRQVADKSPGLRGHVQTVKERIIHQRSGSYFKPISSLGDLVHGANLHAAIVDELHVHRDASMLEAIETGTGARTQPLIVIITTADDGKRETVYDKTRERIEQLARRALEDTATYGVIWGASEDDDPHAEETWRKANPGYGISPTAEFMRAASKKAQQSPADLASFLRLHLGLRTKQTTKYIELGAWDANAGLVDETALAGRECFGGLDLGSVSDLTALCWLFPDPSGDGTYDALWRVWTPEESMRALNKRTAGAAEAWVRRGWLTLTPGNVTDYEWIKGQILRDAEVFTVRDVAYDRWNASQTVNDLDAEGIAMSPIGQGFASLSAPTKELQRLVLSGTPERPVLRHGGNALVRWTLDNLAVDMDAAGNVKPAKNKGADKIDPIAALIDALERTMRTEAAGPSVYEERGAIVL